MAIIKDSKGLKGGAYYFLKCDKHKDWHWAAKSVDNTIGSVSSADAECDLWHVRYRWDIFVFQNEHVGKFLRNKTKQKNQQKGKRPTPT